MNKGMVLWTQPWKKTSDRNPQQTLLTVMLLSLNKRTLMVTFIHVETLWVWEWSLKHKKADLKLKALKIVFRCVRVCVCIYMCVYVGGVAELCQKLSSAGCHDQRAVGPPIRLAPHAHTYTQTIHITLHTHAYYHTQFTQPSISQVYTELYT